MLVTGLSFGEEVCNLKLRGDIVKRNRLITDRTPGEVGINANMIGQRMLDRVSSNLKGAGTVTV